MGFNNIPHIFLVCLSLIIKICLITEAGTSSCPSIQTKTGPPLPTIPNSYQVEVEVNIIDKGYSMDASIYYDFSGNRAVMKTFGNGSQTTVFYNYPTDEIFTIANSDANPVCTVVRLSTSNMTQLFGQSNVNKMLHIGTAQTAFKFGLSFREVYIGNDTVRGIKVDHWRSCGNWSGGIITTDYYFTSNWSTASTALNIPVRAEVRADKHLPNGTIYNLHHVYDYFSFLPFMDQDPSIFQTPAGVVCPGRVSTQMIPPIIDRFYYKVEKVYPDLSAVTFEDVWYDASYRLFRHDYKPLAIASPTYSMNPVTEVHDYTRGVRYVMDKLSGNCTTIPISNYSMDAVQNITASKINGSFVLDMKNPLQFFLLDWVYTYIGQQQVRDILCDVYVTSRPDVYIQGFISSPNTIITVYFISQGWTDISEDTRKIESLNTPIKMTIEAVEAGLSVTYNFVAFDPEPPSLGVFDVSQCYPETSKLTFKMTFPGTVVPTLVPSLLEFSRLKLAQTMAVSVLRVTNLHLDFDHAFVYITTTVLDRTLASAQFTVLPGRTGSRQDDSIIQNVVDYEQCATYCLTNDKSFICNDFDYCSDRSCHLSRYHFDHGDKLNSSSFCSHFSRNVEGYPQERGLTDAFNALRTAVYKKQYVIDQFSDMSYAAVDIAIVFGWANIAVSLPNLPTHFSLRIETSIPSTKQVIASSSWYDGNFNLLRYDQHVSQVTSMFSTTDPLTIIQDYNTGVKYVINKMLKNCTVTQIRINDVATAGSDPSHTASTWQLNLQSPLQLFRIDNSYSFVGQQTIRGMTCNVFEAIKTDVKYPNVTTNVTTVLRYAFLAGDWSETDAGFLRSTNQPVRLETTANELSLYVQYNFYEFNGDTQDLSIFDTHQCFDANQTQPFQIVFPGKYHPALDSTSKMFVIEAVFKMANRSGVSALRFQRTSIDYDNDNIYLTSYLVQHTSNLLYFTAIPGGPVPTPADRIVDGSQTESCSSDCLRETGFNCNSFYVCAESNQCLLSRSHVPVGNTTTHVTGCNAYSRTVQDQGIELSNMMAFIQLKNAVYSGNLAIDIPVSGTESTKTFVATSVRNPIRNPYEPQIKEKAVQEFSKVSESEILKSPDTVIQGLAIDDCASACLDQAEFLCDGFSYYLFGDFGYKCTLSRHHPDLLNTSQITGNVSGYLYTRKYLNDYQKTAGTVQITSSANALIPNIQTNEQCAKLCYTNGKMVCRSFQFCQASGQCLLFNNRVVGVPQTNSGPTCNHYASTFERDFQSVNAGLFQFSSVVSSSKVSVQDCAKFCIDQQGSMCGGFYFCVHVSTCYLTSDTPGHGSHVNTSSSDLNLCQQFSRIYYPPGRSPPTTSLTTGPTVATVTVKIPSTTPTTSAPTTTKAPTTQRTSTSKPTVLSSSTTTQPHGWRTVSNMVPTPQLQRNGDNNSKGSNTGELVGLSVGMFILGLVMGVVGLHFFRRFRGLDKDGLRTNFVTHEDM